MATDTPPDLGALDAMLARYFVGPFDDERVRDLRAQVVAVLADTRRHGGVIADFHPGNGGRGFGLAWREELAFRHTTPSPIEVAAWIAWNAGIPARPYCPDLFVGRWVQHEPGGSSSRSQWEFSADGAMRTDEPQFARRVRWCVHRQSERGPVGDAIWISDSIGVSQKTLHIREIGPGAIVFDALGASNIAYRLRRS